MRETVKEKRVEYLEHVYDLIFVYIAGVNNAQLHHIENGFVSGGVFLAYVFSMLAVIQIWNYSTFYINTYGRNSMRDHIFLIINMYLLYFIADGTSIRYWEGSFYKYNVAWALILINIGVQHLIELKNHKENAYETKRLKNKAAIVFIEAILVGTNVLIYRFTGISAIYIPIFFGISAMIISEKKDTVVSADFAHLTERAMLYVVFTFGEMIIAIASYFEGEITLNTVYFSLMAFLIIVGLFLSYGTLYNKIINREMKTSGVFYMIIHIFLIFALNNISVALGFMREESVNLISKTLFLTVSFLIYFTFLFLTEKYAKHGFGFSAKIALFLGISAVGFAALMFICDRYMHVNIAITVLYVFGILALIHRQSNFTDES